MWFFMSLLAQRKQLQRSASRARSFSKLTVSSCSRIQKPSPAWRHWGHNLLRLRQLRKAFKAAGPLSIWRMRGSHTDSKVSIASTRLKHCCSSQQASSRRHWRAAACRVSSYAAQSNVSINRLVIVQVLPPDHDCS